MVKLDEETTEEKIREYVWLHAGDPLRKIQAGILEEFGENRSLEWISKEREEYLAADEPLTKENSLMEPSIDDEAIQGVAEAFPRVTQEQIREVVRLKTTTRLGYRRIGKRLDPPLGKDTVMRILQMYQSLSKPPKPPVEDEELRKLRAQLAEKERLKRIREEREELLRQDVILSLEIEGDDLVLRIVEDEILKLDVYGPETYQEFKRYCEREGLSTREALQKMGISASKLLDTFDSWYDLWNEMEGKTGMECLIWEVCGEIKAGLLRLDKQKTHAKEEGREESVKATFHAPTDEVLTRLGKAFVDYCKGKGIPVGELDEEEVRKIIEQVLEEKH